MNKLKINIWLNIVIISISIFSIVTGVYSIFSAKLTIIGSIGYVAPPPEVQAFCAISGATNGTSTGTASNPLYATNNTTSTTKARVTMDDEGNVTFGNLNFASSSDTITFNINITNDSSETIAVDIDFESLNLTGITRTVSADYLQIIRPSSYSGTIADNDASIKSSDTDFTFTFTKISGSTPSISGKLKINIQPAEQISTDGYFSSVPTSKTCTIEQVPACDETSDPTKTITIPSYFYYSGRYIKVTKLTGDIPDPITNINTYTNVKVNNGIKLISASSFWGCSITSITLPSSLEEIRLQAFYNCSSLTSITIPSSVTSIGQSVFCNCSSLTSVIFEEGSQLKVMDSNLFNGCSILTEITIPSSVTSIRIGAFSNCSGLTSVTFEEGSQLKVMDSNLFNGCTSLTSITIPSSVTSIGQEAFYDCSSLTSVTFGENSQLTSIGTSAFSNCTSLTSITIPSSVTSIGNYAFSGTPFLTNLKLESRGIYTCGDGKKIMIEASSTDITSAPDLTGVYLIADYAFSNCSSLTSITIPSSVTSIGNAVFNKCSKLTSVTFGENSQLTSIGTSAFSNCTSLTGITIPSSVTSIGSSAFSKCGELTSIIVEAGNTIYDSRDNCNAIIETSTNTLLHGCKNTTIPSSVTSIGSSAFYYCTSLTSITIPSSVTSIGNYAFYNCSGLTSVTFEVITGWKVGGNESLAGRISSTDLAKNAKLLTSTYYYSDWTRS